MVAEPSVEQGLFVLLLDLFADPYLWEIIGLSLQVSLSALAIALLIGLPVGALMATVSFPGRQVMTVVINTLMSAPPVVIGLVVYLLLSRAGPFGVFGLLYTPTAMIIAQAVLITPIIVALSRQHLQSEWHRIGDLLATLGVARSQRVMTLFIECRFALVTVVLAGFGRAISEIGAVMIVGGNIDHYTRVMTTAIALETSRGELQLALALGVVLLLIALIVNVLVFSVGRVQPKVRSHA